VAEQIEDENESVVFAALAAAGRFIVYGVRAGEGIGEAFVYWTPVFQIGSLCTLLGLAAVVGFEGTFERLLGAVLLGVGSLALAGGMIGASAVASTRPPPARPGVQDPATHPLLPPGERRGLVDWGGVHVAQAPLILGGIPIGVTMAVLPLEDGVLLWSPVEISDALFEAVTAIGPVRYIVAPNPSHHLYLEPWARRCPGAELVGPAELHERYPSLAWRVAFDRDTWTPPAGVEAVVVRDAPPGPEIVLLHVATRTLLVADLLLNLGHEPEMADRRLQLVLGMAGLAGRATPPTPWKFAPVDRERLRADLDGVGAMAFERVLVAHGRPIEVDVREAWRDAFRFLYEA
jgi:hypothetical protein